MTCTETERVVHLTDLFSLAAPQTVMRRYCWHGVTIGGTKLWNEIHQENYFHMTGLGCGETTTQVGCTVIKWCKMFLCFVVHPNVAKSWWAQWYKMCCHTYVIMMDACLCVPTGVPHYHGLHNMVEKLQSWIWHISPHRLINEDHVVNECCAHMVEITKFHCKYLLNMQHNAVKYLNYFISLIWFTLYMN